MGAMKQLFMDLQEDRIIDDEGNIIVSYNEFHAFMESRSVEYQTYLRELWETQHKKEENDIIDKNQERSEQVA